MPNTFIHFCENASPSISFWLVIITFFGKTSLPQFPATLHIHQNPVSFPQTGWIPLLHPPAPFQAASFRAHPHLEFIAGYYICMSAPVNPLPPPTTGQGHWALLVHGPSIPRNLLPHTGVFNMLLSFHDLSLFQANNKGILSESPELSTEPGLY